MPGRIFISYRKDDTRDLAGRLYGDLAARFGEESIFRDVSSIEGGDDFEVSLDKALANCSVMLVLIGPKWLGITDAKGRRRLDQADDWVRVEVATALRKKGIKVVPVLVEDTRLAAEEDLPDDLKHLVKRQVRPLSDMRWRGDIEALTDMLVKVPGLALRAAPAAAGASRPGWGRPAMAAAGAVLAGVALAAWLWPAGRSGPDLTGLWRSPEMERTYLFEHLGDEIGIKLMFANEEAGTGRGRLDGKVLKYNATWTNSGLTSNCDLVANDGFTRFDGRCVRSDGQSFDWMIQR